MRVSAVAGVADLNRCGRPGTISLDFENERLQRVQSSGDRVVKCLAL